MQKIPKDEILVLIKLKHPDPLVDTFAFVNSLPDEVLFKWSAEFRDRADFNELDFDKKLVLLNKLLFDYYEQQCNH